VCGNKRDICPTIPERRDHEINDVDSIIQILPKATAANFIQ
jgi:hypothetical protein